MGPDVTSPVKPQAPSGSTPYSETWSLRPGTLPDAATQLGLWRHLCGAWQDERSGAEIAADIRVQRTPGRAVEL
jgi:hypothetical protein